MQPCQTQIMIETFQALRRCVNGTEFLCIDIHGKNNMSRKAICNSNPLYVATYTDGFIHVRVAMVIAL